jgi:hypothetical protein
VVLHMGETGVYHEFTDKQPISNFPLKNTDNKDAPVVILEFPIEKPPRGLYVIGTDPYRQGKSAYSDSLGAVYVYKRMHDITSEKYQDFLVAYYVARPDNKNNWEEQARLLTIYYNGLNLCENDEISFIEYMKAKGDAPLYLTRQSDLYFLKEVVPNTTVNREYGIHRSAEKIRDYLHGCLKKYTEEIIFEERDDNDNIIKRVTGMSKILDPMLLEEIIQFNEDGNFDRIVAFELALVQAITMDPIYGRVSGEDDGRIKSLYIKRQKAPMFVSSKGMFGKRKNKLFV